MTTAHSFDPVQPTQTDLIRYFDTADHITVAAQARHDRAAAMGEMIGEGVA